MPRKKKPKAEAPDIVPQLASQALTAVMEALPETVPELPVPEPLPAAAVPATEKPVRRWADRFMPITGYPQEGIRVLEAKDHSATAIAFDDDQPPSRAEKDAMQDEGVRYAERIKIWAVPANPDTRGATQRLAEKMAGERRESKDRGGW